MVHIPIIKHSQLDPYQQSNRLWNKHFNYQGEQSANTIQTGYFILAVKNNFKMAMDPVTE